MTTVIDCLQERGFIDATTSDELATLSKESLTIYAGFDPTATSLHLGNFVTIMCLAWFQRFGHKPIALVGGATGMIGDPSGKSSERQLLDSATIQKNLKGIQSDLEKILDFSHPEVPAEIVNNLDWFSKINFIDFLRDIGKKFRLGPMLAKDSVRSRLKSPEGMSYTEFSYQVLQGYDFLHLYDTLNTTVQVGGSDQWGNITAGTELIRKERGVSAHGLTFPLLTSSDGKKFGKSEKGAIWLSSELLSPYEFYQHLFRTSDADVCKLMRMLTFMPMKEIYEYEEEMKKEDYLPNTAQKRLAEEVTRIVHGDDGLKTALKVTEGAKPGSETNLDLETLENIAQDMPSCTLKLSDSLNNKLIEVLTQVEMAASKGEARRLIKNGGVYLNNKKITDENRTLLAEDLIDDRLFLLGVGKKKKMLVRIKKNELN